MDATISKALATPNLASALTASLATLTGLDYTTLQRSHRSEDTALADRTIRWLASLPTMVRPMATGRLYPRVVNRIGDLWGHCEYTRLYLQSLLVDRRKGRRGFPPEVRLEIEIVQRYYFEHLSGLPAILWNAVPTRPPKIPHRVFPRPSDSNEIDILPL